MSDLRGTVNVRVENTVTLDNLLAIVTAIVRRTGCLGCGLLGVDVALLGEPAPELPEVSAMPGVRSVTLRAKSGWNPGDGGLGNDLPHRGG